MNTLGVIPARGNSQRLPGKNLLPCGGKSLLQWTCEAAAASQLDEWVVSTDWHDVAQFCNNNGYPWQNRGLPDVFTPILDVLHSLASQHDATHVMLLQPTSPLRTAADIDVCLDMMAGGCQSVASYEDIGKHQELLTTNGAIFGCKLEYARTPQLRGFDHRVYIMPPERSIDVDTAAQLRLCDSILTQGAECE